MEVFQSNVDEGFVTFDDLWLLFYEDQEIVYDDEGALLAGTIQKCKLQQGWGGVYYSMTIKVIAHNGENFTEIDKNVEIPYFESGERILNLPVRPLARLRSAPASTEPRRSLTFSRRLVRARATWRPQASSERFSPDRLRPPLLKWSLLQVSPAPRNR